MSLWQMLESEHGKLILMSLCFKIFYLRQMMMAAYLDVAWRSVLTRCSTMFCIWYISVIITKLCWIFWISDVSLIDMVYIKAAVHLYFYICPPAAPHVHVVYWFWINIVWYVDLLLYRQGIYSKCTKEQGPYY